MTNQKRIATAEANRIIEVFTTRLNRVIDDLGAVAAELRTAGLDERALEVETNMERTEALRNTLIDGVNAALKEALHMEKFRGDA